MSPQCRMNRSIGGGEFFGDALLLGHNIMTLSVMIRNNRQERNSPRRSNGSSADNMGEEWALTARSARSTPAVSLAEAPRPLTISRDARMASPTSPIQSRNYCPGTDRRGAILGDRRDHFEAETTSGKWRRRIAAGRKGAPRSTPRSMRCAPASRTPPTIRPSARSQAALEGNAGVTELSTAGNANAGGAAAAAGRADQAGEKIVSFLPAGKSK